MGITSIFKKSIYGASRQANNGVKVLVVEDEKYLREVCRQKLEMEGFTVFEAVDGEMALHETVKNRPDIILLDIILPFMDGFDVINKIRHSRNHEIADIPIIVMSNLGEKENVDKAMSLGANEYLIKSQFTVGQIVKKIKWTLRNKGVR